MALAYFSQPQGLGLRSDKIAISGWDKKKWDHLVGSFGWIIGLLQLDLLVGTDQPIALKKKGQIVDILKSAASLRLKDAASVISSNNDDLQLTWDHRSIIWHHRPPDHESPEWTLYIWELKPLSTHDMKLVTLQKLRKAIIFCRLTTAEEENLLNIEERLSRMKGLLMTILGVVF